MLPKKKKVNTSPGCLSRPVPVWVLLILMICLIIYENSHMKKLLQNFSLSQSEDISSMLRASQAAATAASAAVQPLPAPTVSSVSSASVSSAMSIPEGSPPNLPSVRITNEESTEVKRGIYGGDNDKPHLGGFTDIDLHGISPTQWKFMVENLAVKSLVDVGCGRGTSTSWFLLHGVDALCVEGSHDAVEKSMIPAKFQEEHRIVEHDFSRGAWWPAQTYDAVWCVEFLEHVGRNFMQNYFPIFRKSAFIFVTHSNWGGWHHVEVHSDDWWIQKFTMHGFVHLPGLQKKMREEALAERRKGSPSVVEGEPWNAQHLSHTLMVFVNPQVAALPRHHHLMGEDGCSKSFGEGGITNRPCGTGKQAEETDLPEEWKPLKLTKEMDEAWENLVMSNIEKPRKG